MIRIMLVDDHPLLRHGVRSVLETQPDFDVVAEAGGLDEAEHLAIAQQIDVALVDLDLGANLPNGVEVTRGIRQANPHAQVLIFTAFDSDADIIRAMDAGATGYLVKDSQSAELFRAIRAAASGDQTLDVRIGARLQERSENPDNTLTARELDVLMLAATGLSNRDLARELFVSQATVKTHLHHAFTKLGVDNRQAAIAAAVKRGLIRL